MPHCGCRIKDLTLDFCVIYKGAESPDFLVSKIRVAYDGMYTIQVLRVMWIIFECICLSASIILYMYFRNLCCFKKIRNCVSVMPEEGKLQCHCNLNESDNNFHNFTVMYPSLYPQLINRNVLIGVKIRQDDHQFLL